MSSDFDRLQAWPSPSRPRTRRMVAVKPSFARLVPSPRQPPVAARHRTTWRTARSENTLRPGPLINYECLIRQTRRLQRE
jgi:hypothetical protein